MDMTRNALCLVGEGKEGGKVRAMFVRLIDLIGASGGRHTPLDLARRSLACHTHAPACSE